jgi:hypothetical protein
VGSYIASLVLEMSSTSCFKHKIVLQLPTSQVRRNIPHIVSSKEVQREWRVAELVPLSFLFILSINQIILFDNYNTKNTAQK